MLHVSDRLNQWLQHSGPHAAVPLVIRSGVLPPWHSTAAPRGRQALFELAEAWAAERFYGVRQALHGTAPDEGTVIAPASCLSVTAGREALRRLAEVPQPLQADIDLPVPHRRTLTGGGISTEPTQGISWALERVGCPLLWDKGVTGTGVVVAVVDTGVATQHPDLAGRMWHGGPRWPHPGYDACSGMGEIQDELGHGTRCAGIVAGDGSMGVRTGVAPGARIMGVKVYSRQGSNQARVWKGIQWAVERGADIISLSMSFHAGQSPDWAGWRSLCDFLLAAGVLLVCSAGNLGHRTAEYPVPYNIPVPGNVPPPWRHPDQLAEGGLSAAITVGAVDERDQPVLGSPDGEIGGSGVGPSTWERVPPYSDYPYRNDPRSGLLKPDLSAPGIRLISLDHSGTGYAGFWGTSGSTPYVAGAAALLLSARPTATPADLCRALLLGADRPPAGTRENRLGIGRLHVHGAYEVLCNLGYRRGDKG